MDGARFDAMARRLVTGRAGRRAVGKALIGGTVGVLLAGRGFGEATAGCGRVGTSTQRPDRCGSGTRCCTHARCGDNGRCTCKRRWTDCDDDGRCEADLMRDGSNCGECGLVCASGECVHGACTCDPFNNLCPNEVDGQCTCGAVVSATGFQAACVDRNSACDLDKPCDSNADCPPRSVCLRGCSDPPDPQPTRCSKPCIPV